MLKILRLSEIMSARRTPGPWARMGAHPRELSCIEFGVDAYGRADPGIRLRRRSMHAQRLGYFVLHDRPDAHDPTTCRTDLNRGRGDFTRKILAAPPVTA